MPTKKKPVSRAKALQSSEPAPVALVVQHDAKWMERWLRQAAPDRLTRSMPERLEALLRSWSIRRALTASPPAPLWTPRVDDKKTGQRKEAIKERLTDLAETWYDDRVYPDTIYFDNWAPHDWPTRTDDADFKDRLHGLCDELRKLSDVMVPDPHDNRRWILMLLEYGWGDGRLKDRRELQESVISGIRKTPVRQRVCEIGEEARDAAYVAVRTNHSLDALHHTKERAQALKDSLQMMKSHASFVGEHLTAKWRAAFHHMVEQMPKAMDFYMENASEGRSRRATAGRQHRPWVDQARRALKDLKLSAPQRKQLLIAWGLVSYPR